MVRIRFGKFLVIASLLVIGISSCSKKEVEVTALEMGYSYFPIDSGIVKIYQVDSISYNDNTQKIDTFQFILKEEFAGIAQSEGEENHRIIKRSVQFPNTQSWEPRSSTFVLATAQNLQQVIENQRIIKLVFPVGQAQSWNGNAYNSLGRRNFTWQKVFASHPVFDSIYSPSLSVLEANINNFVEEVFTSSTYAKNIGLIEFQHTNLNKQASGINGYKIHYKLITYIKP